MPNTIHPLSNMKGEKPMNLDTFLPKHVADELAPLMNRMRVFAQRAADGERLNPADAKEYGQLGQQATKLLTNWLQDPACKMNPEKAARLAARGAMLTREAKRIEDMAGAMAASGDGVGGDED